MFQLSRIRIHVLNKLALKSGSDSQYYEVESYAYAELIDWLSKVLTSQQTHYRSFRGRVFTG